MIVSIASGKGGTGKTTVATNLVLSVADGTTNVPVQLVDCDVEEPNAHIFLKPSMSVREEVMTPVPQVDEGRCTYCGRCAEVCAFAAIAVIRDHVLVFPELCHGCGGCALFCSERAITEVGRSVGVVEAGVACGVDFAHGKLNPGEAMPSPVIRAVKERIKPSGVVILDVPPGTSCPVVESVKGCDYCVLVTEPTPLGLHDLSLAVEMLRKLGIPAGVVVNRCDIGDGGVEDYCRDEGLPVLMRIPWERDLASLYARGDPISLVKSKWKNRFRELYEIIREVSAGRGGVRREGSRDHQREGRDGKDLHRRLIRGARPGCRPGGLRRGRCQSSSPAETGGEGNTRV